MKNISDFLFKFRSYTPIPFLILMLVFHNASFNSILYGFIPILIGEWLRLWGVSFAGSETRTTGKVGGTYLIISGPFAYVKNPLYLGNILIYSGLGIMSFALFPYLQVIAIAYFIFQYYFIIKSEEEYLKETFGNNYLDYYEKVPMLIPQLKPYRNKEIKQPEQDFGKGFKSEKRSLQAIIITILLIILIYLVKH